MATLSCIQLMLIFTHCDYYNYLDPNYFMILITKKIRNCHPYWLYDM